MLPRVKLAMLGSGDAFCDWRVNYENNAVVYTAEGLVLIDCGMTAVQSLRELGHSPSDVAALLVTHLHPDHSSAAALLQERFYRGPDGVPSWQRTRVYAPADVMKPLRTTIAPFFDDAIAPRHGPGRTGIDAVLDEVETTEGQVGDLRFRFFRVPHVTGMHPTTGAVFDKPSYGLELEQGGRKLVWSSDTVFRRDWITATARDPSVSALFHDCTFEARFEETVHTHYSELQTLPADVKARMVLMHHVRVPDGVDVSAWADVARRHQVFEL